MNRLLIIVVGVSVVSVIAFAVVVIGGGGNPQTTPLAGLDTPIGQAQDRANPPAGGVADNRTASVRFDQWADVLRAMGLSVESEEVRVQGGMLVVSGLDIAGPANWLAWRWSLASARVDDRDIFHLESAADQTLTFTVNDQPFTWSITPEVMQISARRAEPGPGTTVIVAFSRLSLGESDAPPVSLADGEFRLNVAEGDGLIPLGSTATLQLTDLVLPGQAHSALGSTIDSLGVDLGFDRSLSSAALGDALEPWLSDTDVIGVSNLMLDWGSLQIVGGDGRVGIGADGRPIGTLQISVVDVLTMLDGFNAVHHLDTDVLADTYARLLIEMGAVAEDEGLPFVVSIMDGDIVLAGGSRGLPDIVLGSVSPLFTPATP